MLWQPQQKDSSITSTGHRTANGTPEIWVPMLRIWFVNKPLPTYRNRFTATIKTHRFFSIDAVDYCFFFFHPIAHVKEKKIYIRARAVQCFRPSAHALIKSVHEYVECTRNLFEVRIFPVPLDSLFRIVPQKYVIIASIQQKWLIQIAWPPNQYFDNVNREIALRMLG